MAPKKARNAPKRRRRPILGDLQEIRQRVEIINREVGEVIGEVRGIRGQIATLQWLVGGTALLAAGRMVWELIAGGKG